MRLFIAIPFPDAIKTALLSAQDQLRQQCKYANFSRPENLHLTLAFLGETNRLQEIKQAMHAVDAAPFSMTIGGFGHFGDLYWAGIRRNPALESLALQLQNALRDRDFAIERRPFRPHITLARQVAADAPPKCTVPSISMQADHMLLMKSERIGGKLTYTPVYKMHL